MTACKGAQVTQLLGRYGSRYLFGIIDRKGPTSIFTLTAEDRSAQAPSQPGMGIICACEANMEAREPERRLRLPFPKEASSLPRGAYYLEGSSSVPYLRAVSMILCMSVIDTFFCQLALSSPSLLPLCDANDSGEESSRGQSPSPDVT